MITDEALMAYLDGEADPDRMRAIEAALAASPPLTARLAALQARDRTIRAAFDGLLDRPVPAQLTASVRRAQAEAADNVIPLKPRAQRPILQRRWTWVGAAIAAQAAVIAAAVVLAPSLLPKPAPKAEYTALSAPPQREAANLMIIFKPDTRESDLRSALGSVEGRVVGGPTPANAWLIHVPEDRQNAAVAAMRKRAEILLAQPVDAP